MLLLNVELNALSNDNEIRKTFGLRGFISIEKEKFQKFSMALANFP